MDRTTLRHVSWITIAAFAWASTAASAAYAHANSRPAPDARTGSLTRPKTLRSSTRDALPAAPNAWRIARGYDVASVHRGRVARGAEPDARFLRDGSMRGVEPPDTTESVFDFPEEEKKNRHLARDITVFVIVSAFVAAFVIEVFLKGDTDTPVDNSPPGKTIP